MKELAGAARRKTQLQFRGNFLDLGDEVSEGMPAAFHAFPRTQPKNRLEFAKWLVSRGEPADGPGDRQPLLGADLRHRARPHERGVRHAGRTAQPPRTARLAGHRVDCEASWDVKQFLKLLVMSATYRQSAKVDAGALRARPGEPPARPRPAVRLSAEMVRDQALFAAGLLSPKMLGPSVEPPQPNLGVNAAFGGAIDWQTSAGEDRYRRGVYTQWRRSNPYPSMSTFDAPNRDTCTSAGARTNTPLQALVTLNDPVYVEAAQALARRAIEKGGDDRRREGRVRVPALPRPAADRRRSSQRLVKLYEDAKAKFANDATKATQFATTPLGPCPRAWTPPTPPRGPSSPT